MKTSSSQTKLYTAYEVADILRISIPKLYRLIRSKNLPAINVGQGKERACWRISQEDLDHFLTPQPKEA